MEGKPGQESVQSLLKHPGWLQALRTGSGFRQTNMKVYVYVFVLFSFNVFCNVSIDVFLYIFKF